MKSTLRHPLEISADAFWRDVFFNHEFLERACTKRRSAASRSRFSRTRGDTPGGRTRRATFTRQKLDAPGPVRKLFGAGRRRRWRSAATSIPRRSAGASRWFPIGWPTRSVSRGKPGSSRRGRGRSMRVDALRSSQVESLRRRRPRGEVHGECHGGEFSAEAGSPSRARTFPRSRRVVVSAGSPRRSLPASALPRPRRSSPSTSTVATFASRELRFLCKSSPRWAPPRAVRSLAASAARRAPDRSPPRRGARPPLPRSRRAALPAPASAPRPAQRASAAQPRLRRSARGARTRALRPAGCRAPAGASFARSRAPPPRRPFASRRRPRALRKLDLPPRGGFHRDLRSEVRRQKHDDVRKVDRPPSPVS